MNIKLLRTTRTPYSEEISVYDVDTRDASNEPVKMGKIDVHYVEDQVVGTLLIWREYAEGYRRTHTGAFEEALDGVIDAILSEISEPVGVSATYAVEVYYPSISGAAAGPGFVSNYPDDEDGEATGATARGIKEDGDLEMEEGALQTEEKPEDDDFANRLRQRP